MNKIELVLNRVNCSLTPEEGLVLLNDTSTIEEKEEIVLNKVKEGRFTIDEALLLLSNPNDEKIINNVKQASKEHYHQELIEEALYGIDTDDGLDYDRILKCCEITYRRIIDKNNHLIPVNNIDIIINEAEDACNKALKRFEEEYNKNKDNNLIIEEYSKNDLFRANVSITNMHNENKLSLYIEFIAYSSGGSTYLNNLFD